MIKYHILLGSLVTILVINAVYAGNWNVPRSARNLENPVTVNKDTLAKGKAIFSDHCVRCHGHDGSGNGTEQKVEYALRNILLMPSEPGAGPLSDGELYWKLTHGIARMPSFAGTLTDDERWTVVNYLRTFTKDDVAEGHQSSSS